MRASRAPLPAAQRSAVRLAASRGTIEEMVTPAKVVAEVLDLPREQRAELASRLLRSLDDDEPGPDEDPAEVAAAWVVEIERRIADRDAGRSTSRPMDEAMSDIKAKLAADRAAKAR